MLALVISGDGVTADAVTVQGTSLEMGGWSAGKCPWSFERSRCISLASGAVSAQFS